jgi:hypothetical protein
MNPPADLPDFVQNHRPHGPLTADATQPAWNGYLLTVACPCVGSCSKGGSHRKMRSWICGTSRR